jgi:anti-sigma factor RsiW
VSLVAVAADATLAGLARVVVRLGVLNASQGKADLALRVDVVNLDFNGLTQAQDVLDGINALAVVEGAHLGDVE